MKTMKSIAAVTLFLMTSTSFAYTHDAQISTDGIESEIRKAAKEEPFFRKSGDRLFLNFFNREMGDVLIKVVDSENRILYSETLKSTLLVEKAFNFENAEKDSYKVIIKDGDETYAEYYVVK